MTTLDVNQRVALDAIDAMRAAIEAGQHIYGEADSPTPDETAHDVALMGQLLARRSAAGDIRRVRVLITYETTERAAR
jgi:hypothetical protein